mgnify:CR=1 FL=1
MVRVFDKVSSPFVVAKDTPKEDLGGGISRQILGYGPEIMLVRVWFETGSVGAVHSHPHSQATYVESGKFEMFIDGEKRVLSAGDSTYMAPNLEHGSVCLEAGVLLDSFSPVREDFLSEGN